MHVFILWAINPVVLNSDTKLARELSFLPIFFLANVFEINFQGNRLLAQHHGQYFRVPTAQNGCLVLGRLFYSFLYCWPSFRHIPCWNLASPDFAVILIGFVACWFDFCVGWLCLDCRNCWWSLGWWWAGDWLEDLFSGVQAWFCKQVHVVVTLRSALYSLIGVDLFSSCTTTSIWLWHPVYCDWSQAPVPPCHLEAKWWTKFYPEWKIEKCTCMVFERKFALTQSQISWLGFWGQFEKGREVRKRDSNKRKFTPFGIAVWNLCTVVLQ